LYKTALIIAMTLFHVTYSVSSELRKPRHQLLTLGVISDIERLWWADDAFRAQVLSLQNVAVGQPPLAAFLKIKEAGIVSDNDNKLVIDSDDNLFGNSHFT